MALFVMVMVPPLATLRDAVRRGAAAVCHADPNALKDSRIFDRAHYHINDSCRLILGNREQPCVAMVVPDA